MLINFLFLLPAAKAQATPSPELRATAEIPCHLRLPGRRRRRSFVPRGRPHHQLAAHRRWLDDGNHREKQPDWDAPLKLR